MAKIVVKQNPEKAEVPTEIIAESVVAIAEGIRRLRAGRLNDKALFLLIQHAAPTNGRYQRIGLAEIKAVFEGIDSLTAEYIRKKPPV